MKSSKNKMLETLTSLRKRLDDPIEGPALIKKIRTEANNLSTLRENLFDAGLPFGNIGDVIMYGMNNDYPDEVLEDLYIGMYSRHGNGD